MGASMQELNEIVARCRRIGWGVEIGNGRVDWKYRITAPNGNRVQLHWTPSDVNWKKTVLRDLNQQGFAEAEEAWQTADEHERKAKILADRKKADDKIKQANKHAAALERATRPAGVAPVDLTWVLSQPAQQDVRAVIMTPEAAEKILGVNTANRKWRPGGTEFFVSVIENGEWGWTHQGIAIDSEGRVQDGQHRLKAIVETGKSVPMYVTIGVPPENFGKIDTGMPRVARDMAYLRGEQNIGTLTSAARMLLQIERYGADAARRTTRVPIDRVDRMIQRCGDPLREAVTRATRIRREMKANAAGLAVAIYLITMKLPEGDRRVDAFLEDFESGIGIEGRQDPVWALRRYFIRHDGGKAPRAFEAAAIVIKAWNLRASGQTRAYLRFANDESFPDVFLPPPMLTDEPVEESA